MSRFNSTKQALRLEALEDRRVMSTCVDMPLIAPDGMVRVFPTARSATTTAVGDLIIDPGYCGPHQGELESSEVDALEVDFGTQLQKPFRAAHTSTGTVTELHPSGKAPGAGAKAVAIGDLTSVPNDGHQLQIPPDGYMVRVRRAADLRQMEPKLHRPSVIAYTVENDFTQLDATAIDLTFTEDSRARQRRLGPGLGDEPVELIGGPAIHRRVLSAEVGADQSFSI